MFAYLARFHFGLFQIIVPGVPTPLAPFPISFCAPPCRVALANRPDGLQTDLVLILTKALALRVGADLKRDRIAVGPLSLRGLHAPEVRHARLVIRIAFEILSENDHGLAAE